MTPGPGCTFHIGRVAGMLLVPVVACAQAAGPSNVHAILQRSLEVTKWDWEQCHNFANVEHDKETKGGNSASQTYRVMMIDGSPYNRLVLREGKPLPPPEEMRQRRLLQEEVSQRANQTSAQRADRIAKYQKTHQRILDLVREMTQAFDFRLTGQEKRGGRENYVLSATPRPGYQPKSRDARILTTMQGKLWIDRDTYQWTRAEAEVTRPVWFGLLFAKVYPGTHFLLEQAPVQPGIWLPQHLRVDVKASILGLVHNDFTRDETYQDYRPLDASAVDADAMNGKIDLQ